MAVWLQCPGTGSLSLVLLVWFSREYIQLCLLLFVFESKTTTTHNSTIIILLSSVWGCFPSIPQFKHTTSFCISSSTVHNSLVTTPFMVKRLRAQTNQLALSVCLSLLWLTCINNSHSTNNGNCPCNYAFRRHKACRVVSYPYAYICCAYCYSKG